MSFQRSQIVSALWSVFAGPFYGPVPAHKVPKPFVRKVSNFLDKGVGITPENRSREKGVFQEYETEDVIELSIALSLQNTGLSQGEIVNYIVGFRETIRKEVSMIPELAQVAHDSFSYLMVVTPRSFVETIRRHDQQPNLRSDKIEFFRPRFIDSQEKWCALARELGSKGLPQMIVIDLGDNVWKVRSALLPTESTSRGRR